MDGTEWTLRVYDLITAHGIWDEQHVRFRAKMAMKYGKEYRMRNIDGRSLARTADLLSMDRNEIFEAVRKLGERVPEAMAAALGEGRVGVGPLPY